MQLIIVNKRWTVQVIYDRFGRITSRLLTGVALIGFGISLLTTNPLRGVSGMLHALPDIAWLPFHTGTIAIIALSVWMIVSGSILVYRMARHIHPKLDVFIVLSLPMFTYLLLSLWFFMSDTTTPWTPVFAYAMLILFMLLCFRQEQIADRGAFNDPRT